MEKKGRRKDRYKEPENIINIIINNALHHNFYISFFNATNVIHNIKPILSISVISLNCLIVYYYFSMIIMFIQ